MIVCSIQVGGLWLYLRHRDMLLVSSHARALIRMAVIIEGLHLRRGLKMHRLVELLTRCAIYEHALASLCTWVTA